MLLIVVFQLQQLGQQTPAVMTMAVANMSVSQHQKDLVVVARKGSYWKKRHRRVLWQWVSLYMLQNMLMIHCHMEMTQIH